MFKAKKLDRLVEAGIISSEQKKQILDFNDSGTGKMVSQLLYLLAFFTIGVGVISVVAANWQDISDAFKLFVMFTLLFLSAWKTIDWRQKGLNDRAEKMLLLLFFLIGAAIGLIIQVYQLSGGKWYSVLALWCLFGLPLLFVTQKKYVACFWIPLFLVWIDCCMWDGRFRGVLASDFSDRVGTHYLYDTCMFGALAFLGWIMEFYVPRFAFGEVLRRYSLFFTYLCLAMYVISAWSLTRFYRLFVAAGILFVSSLIYKHYGAYYLIRRNIKFGGLIVIMFYLNIAHEFGFLQSGFGLILTGAALILLIRFWPKIDTKLLKEIKNGK